MNWKQRMKAACDELERIESVRQKAVEEIQQCLDAAGERGESAAARVLALDGQSFDVSMARLRADLTEIAERAA